jgi:hypothetical protein
MMKAGGGQRNGIRTVLVLLACFLAGNAAPVVVARVQDGETGLPLAGVMVLSEGSDIMAVTDSSGQCLVVALPKKGGTLLVSRTGYLDARQAWSPPAKSAPDSATVDMVLYSNRPRVVVGRVFDAGTKLTIAGADVAVAGTALAESTGADGGFILSHFPSGSQTLNVSFPGYPPKSLAIQVKGGDTSSVDLYLLDTANVGRIEGTAFDARVGAVVPGARVVVEGTGCVAVTDSTGRYAIENVPVGMQRVLVTRAGYVNAYTVVRLVKDWAVTANLYLRDSVPKPTRRK